MMGPGIANPGMGRTLMRGLSRATRQMTEDELRVNLTDIRDRLDLALTAPHDVPAPQPIAALHDDSYDLSSFASGD